MDIYEVIVKPLETEKVLMQREQGQYTFMVDRRANKIQIRQAVKQVYGVNVVSVNVMNMPAKVGRVRGRREVIRHKTWKKAIVTLAPGERIEQIEASEA